MAFIDEVKIQPSKDVQTVSSFARVKRDASAEVGALAPVFEKTATELKHIQKLFECKSTIQTATFNVRTLNIIGQLPELTASEIDQNIDIVCVQEHRDHHSEEDIKYHDTGRRWTFVLSSAWKNSVTSVIGVGMLIRPKITEEHRENSTKDDNSYV